MANVCEVDIIVHIDVKQLDDDVKLFIGTLLNDQDVPVRCIEADIYQDTVEFHCEARWSVNPREAVEIISYLRTNMELSDTISIDIKYLERGFQLCGKYELRNDVLYMGDADNSIWSVVGFIDKQENISDEDWEKYWDILYTAQDNAVMKPIYDFKTKEWKEK